MSRIRETDDNIDLIAGAEGLGEDVQGHEAPAVPEDSAERSGNPSVEVRRNGRLAIVLGLVSGALSLAFLMRGQGTVDWVLGGVLALVALVWAWVAADARTPLLVADDHGIRIRLGRVWNGMPWSELDEVEHQPRKGMLRDGRLVLLPRDADAQDAAIPAAARRRAALSRRLYGVSFAVPLGMTTLVSSGSRDLTERLAGLAGEQTTIVEIDTSLAEDAGAEPAPDAVSDGGAAEASADSAGDDAVSGMSPERAVEPGPDRVVETSVDTDVDTDVEQRPTTTSPTPLPEWPLVAAHRPASVPESAVHSAVETAAGSAPQPGPESAPEPAAAAPEAQPDREDTRPVARPRILPTATPGPQRTPVDAVRAQIVRDHQPRVGTIGATALQADLHSSVVTAPGVTPIARPGEAVEPIVIEEPDVEPAPEPVIGPQLAAARTRLGLTVDQIADRTRIRPHVIESIEVDDFAPCGGDFYARGHLRTLARVLGVEGAPLLEAYDATYADAPLDPRAVFEAELATGSSGTIRRMRGGPNWSVLVAAVMAVVLLWSVARLVMDDSRPSAPDVAGLAGDSHGMTNPYGRTAAPVPVSVTAAGGGSNVVVRDGTGDVVFNGDLAFGQTKHLKASPPVRVQSSDGSVEVSVNGEDPAAIGATGEQAQKTYTAR